MLLLMMMMMMITITIVMMKWWILLTLLYNLFHIITIEESLLTTSSLTTRTSDLPMHHHHHHIIMLSVGWTLVMATRWHRMVMVKKRQQLQPSLLYIYKQSRVESSEEICWKIYVKEMLMIVCVLFLCLSALSSCFAITWDRKCWYYIHSRDKYMYVVVYMLSIVVYVHILYVVSDVRSIY